MTHLLICTNLGGPGEHCGDFSAVSVFVRQKIKKGQRRVFICKEISEGRVLM